MRTPHTARRALGALAAGAALLMPTVHATADTTPEPAPVRTVVSHAAVAEAPDVDVTAVMSDLEALQQIADDNGGHRQAGSSGYDASLAYVEQKLTDAGFEVTRQACDTCSFESDNLIADWPGGDETTTVMFGAHLDSVDAGPGINDNGSGSMAQLEAALAVAQANPEMAGHLRFAWWTDEEQGLNGSAHYVSSLGDDEQADIQAYYNVDMVASANGGYFINHVDSAAAAPLVEFYDGIGVTTKENEEGAGRSDDYSFEEAGIPTSGVAAGADYVKTEAEAAEWGGTAGESYDSCYHRACDSYPDAINEEILDRASDAIASTAWNTTVTQAVTFDEEPTRSRGPLVGVPLR